MAFKKTFVRNALAVMGICLAFGLAGCGQDELGAQRLESARIIADAEMRAAVAQTELRLRKEAEARAAKQAFADQKVGEIARMVVRTSQLTDKAGCKITPVLLAKDQYYAEFSERMSARYADACLVQVSRYVDERKQVAARERAKGAKLAAVGSNKSDTKVVARK